MWVRGDSFVVLLHVESLGPVTSGIRSNGCFDKNLVRRLPLKQRREKYLGIVVVLLHPFSYRADDEATLVLT